MIRRNVSVIFFLGLFLGLLAILFWKSSPQIAPLVKETPEPAPSEVLFHGRLNLLTISDLYVFENTAERDIESLLLYLQGRLSSLHYLYENIYSGRKRLKEDLLIGLWVEIDQDGFFKNVKVQFNNAEKNALNKPLVRFVEKYWRYKKSNKGSTSLLIPFQWHAKYSRSLLNNVQLE